MNFRDHVWTQSRAGKSLNMIFSTKYYNSLLSGCCISELKYLDIWNIPLNQIIDGGFFFRTENWTSVFLAHKCDWFGFCASRRGDWAKLILEGGRKGFRKCTSSFLRLRPCTGFSLIGQHFSSLTANAGGFPHSEIFRKSTRVQLCRLRSGFSSDCELACSFCAAILFSTPAITEEKYVLLAPIGLHCTIKTPKASHLGALCRSYTSPIRFLNEFAK